MKKDLAFKDWHEIISTKLGKGEWVEVFTRSKHHKNADRGGFYAALIKNEFLEEALNNHSWDVHGIDGGKPGFVTYWEDGIEINEYYKESNPKIERIVYWRTFPGIDDTYYEISEEFRLFNDLYQKNNQFYKFNDNGDRVLVAETSEHCVKIKLKFLKEFVSAKNMSLALYFDIMRFDPKKIEELGFEATNKTVSGNDFIYNLGIRNIHLGDNNSQGWILGKKIIKGIENYKPKFFELGSFEEFIIGLDDEGNEIYFTSNEEELANYFGKNPNNPHYLTLVYFKKEVLSKYFANPKDYTVTDGAIERHGFWFLRIDNNANSELINVFLGDLGKLHHSEQLYWKSFNVFSESGMSHTNWQRSFQGEFSDPNEPDLYFKYAFQKFQNEWHAKYKWHLFKPLEPEDEFYFRSLHSPLNQDQKEFDEQILGLTKILIDSINEAKLKSFIHISDDEKLYGIDKFNRYLNSLNLYYPEMIQFMRDLQALRSTGVAHRKGENYQKIKKGFDLNDDNFKETFDEILIKSIRILNTLKTKLLENHT